MCQWPSQLLFQSTAGCCGKREDMFPSQAVQLVKRVSDDPGKCGEDGCRQPDFHKFPKKVKMSQFLHHGGCVY